MSDTVPAFPAQRLYPATAEALEVIAVTLTRRLLEKADVTSFTGCWLWRGATDGEGYGVLNVSGKKRPAHRMAYVLARGPVQDWLTVDHLCRVIACINPLHLEAVSPALNSRRSVAANGGIARGEGSSPVGRPGNRRKLRTHCTKGHPFDAENTRWRPRGDRVCRTCDRERLRERDRKARGDA